MQRTFVYLKIEDLKRVKISKDLTNDQILERQSNLDPKKINSDSIKIVVNMNSKNINTVGKNEFEMSFESHNGNYHDDTVIGGVATNQAVSEDIIVKEKPTNTSSTGLKMTLQRSNMSDWNTVNVPPNNRKTDEPSSPDIPREY